VAEVKWIKLSTDVFSNRKIKQIRKMPEGRAILLIWFYILCLAGETNDNGYIYLTKDIPFTEEMLATEFDEELNVVRLALSTFKLFGMLDIVDSYLLVSNWEKYQNVAGLESIREKTRLRVAKHRQKALENKDVTLHETLRNATDIDIDKEEEIEVDKEINNIRSINTSLSTHVDSETYISIQNYWNSHSSLKEITAVTDKRKGNLNARIKEHGIEAIYKVIDNVRNSRFLRGYNNKGWMASFDWVFLPNNFVKVLEGNYLDNKNKAYDDITARVKEAEEALFGGVGNDN